MPHDNCKNCWYTCNCPCHKWGRRVGMKRKYTIDNPPRVYEVAKAIRRGSQWVLDDMQNDYGLDVRSPSSRIPLPIALAYLNTAGK